jgi:hypothetical protein
MERFLPILIGAAVTLIAVAALAAFGASFYKSARNGNEVNDLLAIGNGYRQAYILQPNNYPAALSPTLLIAAGKADPAIVNTTQNGLVTRWGAGIVMAGLGATFTATLPLTPSDACLQIVTDGSLVPIVSQVQIGGAAPLTPPIDPGVATTDCGINTSNTLVVTFKGS